MNSTVDGGSGTRHHNNANTRRTTAWMAARARNAAKRGGLIAGVGLLAVAATLMALVLVPREVNRTVRARINALPPIVDTLPLLANLTGATDRLRNAEATLQYLRQAEIDRVASAASNAGTTTVIPASANGVVDQSDARKELTLRTARARTAPLVENFRALGEADLLRGDARARLLLDSLNDVNRDREAYAALNGPDARYAAMTAKLATLGQRLLVLAEQRLSPAAGNSTGATSVAAAAPPGAATRLGSDSGRATEPRVDTTLLTQPPRLNEESAADSAARQSLDAAKLMLQSAEKTLADVRLSNTRTTEERIRVEAESPARVPPVAMLFAALVTGVAVGFGCAFFIEMKRPHVADAAEVERVTDARVIVHTGATLATRTLQTLRRADDGVPPVIDATSEAYHLLHVTLTGYGDTSREVQVISSDALLGATIAINLAVAAVRDSRATLLIDASAAPHLVNRLLRNNAGDTGTARVPSSDTSAPKHSPLITARVGRELSLDTMSLSGESNAADLETVQTIARDHDFTVVVRSESNENLQVSPLPAADVILCARVGVTRLDWLITRTAELREQQHRVRAVLLWSTRAPTFW